MKVDKTKFTAQYENGAIKAIWATVEVSLDPGLAESPHDAFDLSKKITDEWYAKQSQVESVYAPAPSTEIPVINKAEKREIGINPEDILSSPDLVVLETYRWLIKGKPELERAYVLRYDELSKQT